jgi:hypothetical protein
MRIPIDCSLRLTCIDAPRRQLMSAVAALQAAGLSSAGFAPPPLSLKVAASLNLDRTPAGGLPAADGAGGRLFADAARASGGADTSKRWQEQELGVARHRGSSSDGGGNHRDAAQAGGAAASEPEIWLMPSLDLGVAPLPGGGAHHPASAATGLPTVDESGPGPAEDEAENAEGITLRVLSGGAAAGLDGVAGYGNAVRCDERQGASASAGVAGRAPKPGQLLSSRPPAAAARGYGEEEMFSIRKGYGGGGGGGGWAGGGGRPASPVAAQHPAMGIPAGPQLSAGVVAATAAPL